MNIECDQATLDELESGFRFNGAILRSLTLLQKQAVTDPSPIALSGNDGSPKSASRVKEEVEDEQDEAVADDVAAEAVVEAE